MALYDDWADGGSADTFLKSGMVLLLVLLLWGVDAILQDEYGI